MAEPMFIDPKTGRRTPGVLRPKQGVVDPRFSEPQPAFSDPGEDTAEQTDAFGSKRVVFIDPQAEHL